MSIADKHNYDALKEDYAQLCNGLEVIVSYAGDLFSCDEDTGMEQVIATLTESIEQLGFFESFAFYGVVDQIDFQFISSSASGIKKNFDKDIDGHIEHGTFAWALKNAKTINAKGPYTNKEQVLFALATRRRIHGMFIGNAKQGVGIPGYIQNLIRLVITLAAQSIDNYELTNQIKSHNLDLEHKIAVRTEQLEIAKQKAEGSARSKSAFLANMSHEIRTPMNGVLGMLELLNNSGLNQKQKQYVGNAHRSGSNLLVILNDILDLSKFEAGKVSLDKTEFDLHDMITDVVGLFSAQTQEKEIELVAWLDKSVPDYIVADRTRLWQLISNLIGNAVKFTPSGHIAIHVSCASTAEDKEQQLRFKIHDTGIGLEPEVMQKIFDPFEQAELSTTRHFGGTGLGLALCKRLCDSMGGEIGVESEPGKGSLFWFTITVGRSLNVSVLQALPVSVTNKRVLVVDDLLYSRRSIEALLSRYAIDVTLADSASMAIHLLEQSVKDNNQYDVLLIDEEMPEVSGNELLVKLNKDDRFNDIKAWLMSVRANTVEDKHSGSSDIEGIISKPLQPASLEDIFLSCCDEPAGKTTKSDQITEFPMYQAAVLLVEDNEVNQMVAKGMFNLFGITPTVAENGAEALTLINDNHFDIIFMDVQMPVMNGLEATREIRQSENSIRRVPIIGLSAAVLEEDVDECYQFGMDDFLAKPFTSEGLSEKLQKWLTPKPAEAQSK